MLDERLDSLASSVIRQTLQSLPSTIQEAAKSCIIETVFMADCQEIGEELDEDLLGLFEGSSLVEQEPEVPDQMPRIRLFLDNLWDYAEGKPSLFRKEVRLTLLHELGHYLGLDEDQIAARGLE